MDEDDICMCDDCLEFGWHDSKDAIASRAYAKKQDEEMFEIIYKEGE